VRTETFIQPAAADIHDVTPSCPYIRRRAVWELEIFRVNAIHAARIRNIPRYVPRLLLRKCQWARPVNSHTPYLPTGRGSVIDVHNISTFSGSPHPGCTPSRLYWQPDLQSTRAARSLTGYHHQRDVDGFLQVELGGAE
jgi:hypothetical protein